MKKIWLALAGMILAFSASAAQITDGKQYITLDKPVAGEPQVLEFSRSTARTAISLKKFFMCQIT
ncbi:periplasmic thiol:disulfide interchange protein DsbA [Klebsiella michiganensis]|nr:periplasmic thiol:disulfide interchange protein DsbA [Klebsiella michiganensis]